MTFYEKLMSDLNSQVTDEEFKKDIESALFDKNTTDEQIIDILDNFYIYRNIDSELLKKSIDEYTTSERVFKLSYVLSQRLEDAFDDDIMGLQNYTVELIVSPNGYKRYLGRSIWDYLDFGSSDIDLLSLPEETQGMAAFSLLSDLMSPDTRINKILILFNSSSKSVRGILLNFLIPFTFNFFGTVKKTFEEMSLNDSDELRQFKQILDACEERFSLSRKCVELCSEQAMPEVYETCRREQREHMREQTKEAEKNRKKSFMDLFTTVQLGRGGGWRRHDGKVQPLGKFEYSKEMPMMANSLSPMELTDHWNRLFKDFSKHDEYDEETNN